MKDIAKMRLGVIREVKNIKKFLDMMERSVKTRDYQKVYTAYTFLTSLVYHMNEGDLTPDSIELKKHVVQEYFKDKENENRF